MCQADGFDGYDFDYLKDQGVKMDIVSKCAQSVPVSMKLSHCYHNQDPPRVIEWFPVCSL